MERPVSIRVATRLIKCRHLVTHRSATSRVGSGSFGGQDGILVPRRSAGYGSQRIVHWGIQDRRSSMYTNDREIANEIL